MILSVTLALAGSIFTDVPEAIETGANGNWPRAFRQHDDSGWWILNADSTGYMVSEAAEDLLVDPPTRRYLEDQEGVIDHGIAQCPDGTFFHASTDTNTNPDDTLYVATFDKDFQWLSATNPYLSDEQRTFVDPPVFCADWGRGVGYMGYGEPPIEDALAVFNENSELDRWVILDQGPDASGSTLLADDEGLWSIGGMFRDRNYLRVARYNTNFELRDYLDVDCSPSGTTFIWYQSAIAVNEVFIVASIGQNDAEEWSGQTGNIYITAFDADWNMIDQEQVTDFSAPDGGFHPYVVYHDGKVVVMYTYQFQNWAVPVTIDVEATEGGDTGTVDTGTVDTGGDPDTGGDTGTDTDTDTDTDTGVDTDTATADTADADTGKEAEPDCGCSSGGMPNALAAGGLALLTVARRRKTTH